MDEIRCRIEAALLRPDGVAVVRVRQLGVVSWRLGEGASLGGYAIRPLRPGHGIRPSASAPREEPGLFMASALDLLVFEFELLHADELICFTPGEQVVLRPGIPRIGPDPQAV